MIIVLRTIASCLFVGSIVTLASCQNKPENTDNSKATEAAQMTDDASKTVTPSFKNLKVEEFRVAMKANPDAVVVDVRTPGEFGAGHIEGAVNIDYEHDSFASEIEKLDKNKTYLVYCQTGRRSAEAAKMMSEAGFTDVSNMLGGYRKWSD